MAMGRIREWMEGDEIARVGTNDEEIHFGKLIEENSDRETFRVAWVEAKTREKFFEDNFNPNDEKLLRLLDRQHSEGMRCVRMEDGKIGDILKSSHFATIYVPHLKCIIEAVPMESLRPFTLFTGERILYHGWIGKVSWITYSVVVEYSDGIRGQMEMTQHLKSNTSFGFDVFEKSAPPFENLLVTPTKTEYKTMEWLGTGFFDTLAHLAYSHSGSKAKVLQSSIKYVGIKWICPLHPLSTLETPRAILVEADLCDIVDFDYQFKTWLKLHVLCEYTIKDGDEGIDENALDDQFISELLKQVNPQPEFKRLRRSPPEARLDPLEVGSKHFVEVIRLHHAYWVDYGNGNSTEHSGFNFKLESGSALSPFSAELVDPYSRLELLQLYHRELVVPKFALLDWFDIRNMFGVTQHRDLTRELIIVDFYKIHDQKNQGTEHIRQLELAKYELFSHPIFGYLKPGAIVSACREYNNSIDTRNVGTVIRVSVTGKLEVQFGSYNSTKKEVAVCCPSDLIVRVVPDEIHLNCDSCSSTCLNCPLDEEQVDFAECVANDLREIIDRTDITEIKLKQKSPQSMNSFSVLMKGPPDTPYEYGLFKFDVELPSKYPNVPPLIKMSSLPPDGEFFSHNFAKDWSVLHPRFMNWEPENSKARKRWGWSRTVSLLDLLIEIREDIFTTEPILSRVGLRFKDKEAVFNKSSKFGAEAIAVNSALVVTTVDMLIAMALEPLDSLWKNEVDEHFKTVKPLLAEKYRHLLSSRGGFYGSLNTFPKFHIFPISAGLAQTLARRILMLEDERAPSNDSNQ